MKVIGMKRVDYKRKSDNAEVKGWNIFCTYTDESIQGLGCKDFYVSDRVLSQGNCYMPSIHDDIDFFYNQYKQIASIYKIEG